MYRGSLLPPATRTWGIITEAKGVYIRSLRVRSEAHKELESTETVLVGGETVTALPPLFHVPPTVLGILGISFPFFGDIVPCDLSGALLERVTLIFRL